jgi:general secretion pathway protein C
MKKHMAKANVKKRGSTKIAQSVKTRIIELSLQNPEFGAKGLLPLLNSDDIDVSASTVYSILKHNNLQTRSKRLAKLAERSRKKPASAGKKRYAKITDEVAERIVQVSLQNPDFGARRLTPLLQKEEIFVSASAVYRILKRNSLGNRQKRLLKLEAQLTPETLAAPKVEGPEPFAEPAEKEATAAADEAPEQIFEPAVVAPMPPEAEAPAPVEEPETIPEPLVAAPAKPERPAVRKAPIKPVKKRGHWVFYPLDLLLFLLIGYLGFHAVQTIQYARLETKSVPLTEPPKVGIAARAQSAASVRPLDDYRQIWERNLFNTGAPKKFISEKKFSIEKIALAKKDLGLELVGTVVVDDSRLSRAIIDNRKTREQEAYREGETAGKVRIKKILRNKVVISTAKGDKLLTVEIKESGKSAPLAESRRIGSRSASANPAPVTRRSRARNRFISLKRDEVAASLADVDQLLADLDISPIRRFEKPAGFRISNISNDSILRKMGLSSRDVIVAINDQKITNPDQAAEFFETIADGGKVTIQARRRLRTRRINLSIK